ncbi:MAG TPA: HAD family hydrolase, partial [Mobilitalea sp.]|nr:HAD family hydrolase [Mobilitalea sp.]
MNTFIFDLDGTLLPMPNQELFVETYMKALSKKIVSHGMEPQSLIKAVWTATGAMLKNDGTMTNEQRFWKVFSSIVGEDTKRLEDIFDHFYRNEFIAAKETTSTHPHAMECINALKKKGYQVVLATNPLFPRVATLARMDWAGLNPEDFELITTYENSSFCKPNLEYYTEILDNIKKKPMECIMIGNDVKEDMCAAQLGMETFLLKECL